MHLNTDPNIHDLQTLSATLSGNIRNAQIEFARAKDELEALQYSKELLDESINILVSNSEIDTYQTVAYNTLYPSGSMAISLCRQFDLAPSGPERILLADQIYTTIQSAVSAYVVGIPEENRAVFEPLEQKLIKHSAELLSLEDRLSARLAVHSKHLQTILQGALKSFRDADNPLRFVNTGNALRELLREFLDKVAPNSEIVKAPWFIPADDSKSGITRRHRIDFAIFGNLTKEKFPSKFGELTDKIADALLKDVRQLSKLTHVTEQILDTGYSDAAQLFVSVMQRFILLVSGIESSHAFVEKDIAAEITSNLDTLFTCDFFDELDCLSSHTRPQGVCDVKIQTLTFDSEFINFAGCGWVECDLQMGSDGDVSRGDGAEWPDAFLFTFSGQTEITNLSNIKIDRDSISIDTSSYYGDQDWNGQSGQE